MSDAPAPKKLLVDLREAAQMLSLSERTVWGMVKDGSLRSVRFRRALRIPMAEVERLAQVQPQP